MGGGAEGGVMVTALNILTWICIAVTWVLLYKTHRMQRRTADGIEKNKAFLDSLEADLDNALHPSGPEEENPLD